MSRISSTPIQEGAHEVYPTLGEARTDRRMYADNGHTVGTIELEPTGYGFNVWNLWTEREGMGLADPNANAILHRGERFPETAEPTEEQLARFSARMETAMAAFEFPEADPAEADPDEAEPVMFSKIKRDGLWTPARFHQDLAELIGEVQDEPWPAVICAGVRIIWANRHAVELGLTVGREL